MCTADLVQSIKLKRSCAKDRTGKKDRNRQLYHINFLFNTEFNGRYRNSLSKKLTKRRLTSLLQNDFDSNIVTQEGLVERQRDPSLLK